MNLQGLDRWMVPYLLSRGRRKKVMLDRPVHLLLCICDHYEPGNGGVAPEAARGRVATWATEYPKNLGAFRDSDGRPPRHTFFYPMEQYVESHLDCLRDFCAAGFGEVEIHLHHDRDTAEALREKLIEYRTILSDQHGLLGRDRNTGEPQYAFIHGDWALNNSLPDGTCCGVNDECTVLKQTGCYADFTLPSAPCSAQTSLINRIYYAKSSPNKPCGHAEEAEKNAADALMLVQGPLVLNWGSRKWGVVPRIENGCVQGNQPLAATRIRNWLRARVQVANRPDWYFVKLHTHGAPEANHESLFGVQAQKFHSDLAALAKGNAKFRYHYLSAREMYNAIRAAESGKPGEPIDFANLCIDAPPYQAK